MRLKLSTSPILNLLAHHLGTAPPKWLPLYPMSMGKQLETLWGKLKPCNRASENYASYFASADLRNSGLEGMIWSSQSSRAELYWHSTSCPTPTTLLPLPSCASPSTHAPTNLCTNYSLFLALGVVWLVCSWHWAQCRLVLVCHQCWSSAECCGHALWHVCNTQHQHKSSRMSSSLSSKSGHCLMGDCLESSCMLLWVPSWKEGSICRFKNT